MKENNKVAVIGVVYPGVEHYLDDYFYSLENQVYKEFDICIFNDGMDSSVLNNYLSKYPNLNIYVNEILNSFTPAQIREYAILDVKDKYDYLIFSDTDDYFSSNRIKKSLVHLCDYDFCYNDMILIDNNGMKIENKTYFDNKNNPVLVNNYLNLLGENFCGLSNTAINLKTINLDFLMIPADIIAVDWWIFSILSMKNYKGYFIKDVYTYYRQHESNIIGGLNIFDKNTIIRGIKVKKNHYSLLLKLYPSIYDYSIKKELENVYQLESIMVDKVKMQEFIDYINNLNREYMWWEIIKLN